MGAPTDQDVADIVAAIEKVGMKVIHANKWMHFGRMILVVVGEDSHHSQNTVFEIWPEGLDAAEIAEQAAAWRSHGPGYTFEIGDNPRKEA